MDAVVFTGGEIAACAVQWYFRSKTPDLVIAADRGLEFCFEQKIRPDFIVGDFDSIRPEVIAFYRKQQDIPIDTYRPEKDMTDTDIALEMAVSLGVEKVTFFGATGTRLDHTMSNIFNLCLLKDRGILGQILDAHNRIRLPLGRQLTIRREQLYGENISLFPVRGAVTGLTLEGFQYSLRDRLLAQGDGGLCVSNRLASGCEEGTIRWESGDLLVMETRD